MFLLKKTLKISFLNFKDIAQLLKDTLFPSYHSVVFALMATCVLLVCIIIAYVIFDIPHKGRGIIPQHRYKHHLLQHLHCSS